MAAPPPTVVLLVRHGTTPTTGKVLPGRAPGLSLADAGRTQAEALAGAVAALPRVDAVYASPLERAVETATPLAERRGLPVQVDEALLECDFGEWTGTDLAELRKLDAWQAVQHRPSRFRFPGGESFREMQDRIRGAVERYVDAHTGGVVVAVSHADPIKALLADALGLHLDLFQRVVVGTASVSAVLYPPDGAPGVVAVNASAAGLPALSW